MTGCRVIALTGLGFGALSALMMGWYIWQTSPSESCFLRNGNVLIEVK